MIQAVDMSNERKPKRLSDLVAEAHGSNGIACPKCKCRHFYKTTHSVPRPDTVERRKVCRNCGYVIKTYESLKRPN